MKILIIDDNEITVKYLEIFINSISGHDYDIEVARNFESAMLFLDDRFDIVLCDNFLGFDSKGDEILGINFLLEYAPLHTETFCFLYSQDHKEVNHKYVKKMRCYSLEEVEIELTELLENINGKPMLSEAVTMHQVANYTGFSKELCDTLHKENTKDHNRLEARQDSIVSDMKGIAEHFQKSIDKVVEKLDDSNKKLDNSNIQGRNMFWGMIVFGGGVMGTCLTMAFKVFFAHQ